MSESITFARATANFDGHYLPTGIMKQLAWLTRYSCLFTGRLAIMKAFARSCTQYLISQVVRSDLATFCKKGLWVILGHTTMASTERVGIYYARR